MSSAYADEPRTSGPSAGSGVLVVLKQKMQNLKDDLEKYKDMYEDKCSEVARERSRRIQVFTLWFTLCSLTGSRCNQQGLGLSGLVHEKAHPVVPDIAQSRLECIDTGCIHRLLVQQIPPINDLAWKNIFSNIPSAPGLNQFACMTPSTFTVCIQDKQLMKCNTTKPSIHFENLNKVLSISSLLQSPKP